MDGTLNGQQIVILDSELFHEVLSELHKAQLHRSDSGACSDEQEGKNINSITNNKKSLYSHADVITA